MPKDINTPLHGPSAGCFSVRRLTPVASAARGVQAVAELLIYGDIGESWYGDSVSAANFVAEIAALDVAHLDVRINSYGGSVTDGIAIHNAIKRHPAKVSVFIDGIAASISSLIAMAGDEVNMAENAMLMVHAPWGGVMGNAAELREYADMLDAWAKAMSTSYASKTGQSAEAMLALLTDGKDHWFVASEAKAGGFVDAVIGASAESATAAASFDLSRFSGLPAVLQAGQRFIAAAAAMPPVAAATFSQEPTMPQGNANPTAANNTSAATTNTPASTMDVQTVLVADGARRAAIRAAAQPFMAHAGMNEFVAGLENDHSVTESLANQRILARLGASAEPVAGGRVVTVEDEGDKRRAAMVDAMLIRAGHAGKEVLAASGANPYRGRTLLAMAEASLVASGMRTDGFGDSRKLVAAAFTQGTGDFPTLLENMMHKVLLNAYTLQALTWSRFCKRGTVSDFRAHNRYRTGSLGNLLPKTELGEYKSVSIPDGEKSQIAAATKGYILNISREAIINDDMGALSDQAAAAGRAAARTVETDVYAVLTSNAGLGPILADGKTLFHADHGNIATAAAMSVDALDAMRVLMSQQKDVSGNDFLDLRPDVLLCAVGYGGAARVIIGAEYDTSVTSKFQVPNKVRGIVRDIVDSPRLSGTRYSMLASTSEAPAIEVAFLNGDDMPYLETAQAFDTDGGKLKVRLDYGVAGHDYRGAVTNAGA